jgi:Recombination endonuclease VII
MTGILHPQFPHTESSHLERRRMIERKANLKRYGLTPERFAEMKLRQRGVCRCGKSLDDPGIKPCVDHIHGTTVVRGILCNNCNLVIGHAFENPEVLRALAEYLELMGHV